MEENQDVDQLLEEGGGQIKKNLLDRFLKAFTNGILYKKTGRRYVEVVGGGAVLRNNGYFIQKSTLESLNNAISDTDGGVWINFAVGRTNRRGNEIQLVLTASNTQDELLPTDLGTYCATTAQVVWPTVPPLTGDPSPRDTGGTT